MTLVSLDVEGLAEAQEWLGRRIGKVQSSLHRMVGRVGQESVGILRTATPRSSKPGPHLADGYTFRYTGEGQGVVENRSPKAWLIPLLIRGTGPHIIRPRTARALAVSRGGGVYFYREVNHPGTSPNDFLSAAMRQIRDAVAREQSGLAGDILSS